MVNEDVQLDEGIIDAAVELYEQQLRELLAGVDGPSQRLQGYALVLDRAKVRGVVRTILDPALPLAKSQRKLQSIQAVINSLSNSSLTSKLLVALLDRVDRYVPEDELTVLLYPVLSLTYKRNLRALIRTTASMLEEHGFGIREENNSYKLIAL